MSILVQMFGSVAGITAQLGVFIFGAYLALSGKGVTAGTTMIFEQLMNYVLSPIGTLIRKIDGNTKGSDRQCMSVRAFDYSSDNGQATECCQIVASGDVQRRKALIFKGVRWSDITPTRPVELKLNAMRLSFIACGGPI